MQHEGFLSRSIRICAHGDVELRFLGGWRILIAFLVSAPRPSYALKSRVLQERSLKTSCVQRERRDFRSMGRLYELALVSLVNHPPPLDEQVSIFHSSQPIWAAANRRQLGLCDWNVARTWWLLACQSAGYSGLFYLAFCIDQTSPTPIFRGLSALRGDFATDSCVLSAAEERVGTIPGSAVMLACSTAVG